MKWLILTLCLFLSVGIAGAEQLTTDGTFTNKTTSVTLTSNTISFSDARTGLSVSSGAVIDDTPVDPTKDISTPVSQQLAASSQSQMKSGGKMFAITPSDTIQDIHFSYIFLQGESKETIVLDAEHDLYFPVTIPAGEKMIPWENGEWKIVSATDGDTMTGIIAEKPTVVDANGISFPASYTWDGVSLHLNYDKSVQVYNDAVTKATNLTDKNGILIPQFDTIDITYPITIDPTWIAVSNYYTYNDGTYTYLMFNTTGATNWTPPYTFVNVSVFIVGGGGGGGGSYYAGGGGGGQVANTTFSFVTGIQNVTVGMGGTGGANATNGGIGGISVFGNITQNLTAQGGGGGAASVTGGGVNGVNGACGGGGSGGGATTGGTGTAGYNGGAGSAAGNDGAGGGGGNQSAGVAGTGTTGGNGGLGIFTNFTGVSQQFSCGGGGAISGALFAGVGGCSLAGYGANNSVTNAGAATANSGSGGGGTERYGTLAGGAGGSGIVLIKYLTPPPPVPAFTANVTLGNAPLVVSFTDQSQFNISSWNWTFGDSNVSAVQNPIFTYNIPGTYNVNLTIGNLTGNASLVKNNYIQVNQSGYPYAGFTETPTSGTPGVLVGFTDTSNLWGNTSTTYLWSFGDTAGTSPTSTVNGSTSHVYAYAGIFTPTLTITNNKGTNTFTGPPITVSTNQAAANTNLVYNPWQVRFDIQDYNANPLPGTFVTAYYVNNTLPSTNINWLVTNFGVPSSVAVLMVNGSVAMNGTTDMNGGLSFSMFKSLQYNIVVTNATIGVNSLFSNVYPTDQEYRLKVNTTYTTTTVNRLAAQAGTSLPVYLLNQTGFTDACWNLSMVFKDTTGITTDVRFNVWNRNNGTVLLNKDEGNPGISMISDNYTVCMHQGYKNGNELVWNMTWTP